MPKKITPPNCGTAIEYFRKLYSNSVTIKKEHKSKIQFKEDFLQEIYNGDKWVQLKLTNASSTDYIIFLWKNNYKKSVLRVVEIHKFEPKKIVAKKKGFEQCWRNEFNCKDVTCICEDYKFIFIYTTISGKTEIELQQPRASSLLKSQRIIAKPNCTLP